MSISSAGKLAAIALILFGASCASMALESQTMQQGMAACDAWCNANRKGIQLIMCHDNCNIYWSCNGSDSTPETCQQAKSITQNAAPTPVNPAAPSVPVKSVAPTAVPVVPMAK
jgi:hypothetical protein